MIKISRIYSPFEFLYPEDFVGRKDIIDNFISKITLEPKKPKYFLITGNNRMGKTSLQKYFRTYVEDELKFLSCSAYLNNERINDLETVSETIISNLLCNATIRIENEEELNDVLEKFNINLIKTSDISNISWNNIEFTHEFLKKVNANFGDFFLKLINQISPNGIYFEIDTSTRLEDIGDITLFSKWILEFIEYLENIDLKCPLIFVLALPKENSIDFLSKDDLLKKNFTLYDIKKLNNSEVKTYLKNGFDNYRWELSDEVMDMLVELSLGHPEMMNNFGENIYWNIGVSNRDFSFLYGGMSIHATVENEHVNSMEEAYSALETIFYNDYYMGLLSLDNESEINSLFFSILNKILKDFKQKFDGYYYFNKSTLKLTSKEEYIFEDFIKRLEKYKAIKFNKYESAYEFTDSRLLIDFQIWSYKHILNPEKTLKKQD